MGAVDAIGISYYILRHSSYTRSEYICSIFVVFNTG